MNEKLRVIIILLFDLLSPICNRKVIELKQPV